jgi:DNA adenine methylase
MVYYLGSKADHADEILKIILAQRKPQQTYVEPFVGGANVICRVPNKDGPRIGADINPYMVALHKALADGWEPPKVMSEIEYNRIKRKPKDYPPELVAFAGTGCSFGSQWLGSYARNDENKEEDQSHYNRCRDACRYALKQAPGLRGAAFIHASYDQLPIPPNSLIYCDPPYVGTAGYMDEHQEQWRAYKFWRWADKMVDEGHTVFVSEYKEPQPGDIYPAPPMTEAHRATLKEAGELQQQMVALGDKPTPPAMAARREELWSMIKDHEAKRAEEPKRLAARWKVVWSKEVKVNFAAVNVDAGKGEEAKTETEKLFHREA